MKSFKNRENVLTRLVSLDYTGFSKGFRIIERLYPMHEGQNDFNPLIYKGLLLVLPRCKKWLRDVYFMLSIFGKSILSCLLSIGYYFIKKVKLLKLSRVLTCEKFLCKNIARAQALNMWLLCATRGSSQITLIFRAV